MEIKIKSKARKPQIVYHTMLRPLRTELLANASIKNPFYQSPKNEIHQTAVLKTIAKGSNSHLFINLLEVATETKQE